MCVLALAWRAHPRWLLIAAGNRDERHDRASAPLGRWDDAPSVVAGRDRVAGGTWMGVSEAGRFAVVTNVSTGRTPDPALASRGALVAGLLDGSHALGAVDADSFNPFNLLLVDGGALDAVSNRPAARRRLAPGIHALSNGALDAPWPRAAALAATLAAWMAADAADPDRLFDALAVDTPPEADAIPVFIRSPVYGTRCSTIVAIDGGGRGTIAERRFDAAGAHLGDSRLSFAWPAP